MMQNRSVLAVVVLVLCVVAHAQKNVDPPVTGTIDGKVVNESGQPLAGATVFVRMINTISQRTTTSDADGNFRVNGLEAGLYAVAATSPAYAIPPAESTPTYYRIGDSVRVEMVRGGAISGTVTTSSGEPVIAVRVRALMVRDARGQVPKTQVFGFTEQATDDRGIYRIYGLPPGTYVVSAGGSGFITNFNPYDSDVPTFAPSSTRDTAAEITLKSGDDIDVDIRYRGEPGHSVSGTVKLQSTSNASVTLSRPGTAIPLAVTVQLPGSRGFLFTGLGDGDYDVLAQESIFNPTFSAATLAFSEPKRITIKGADISGLELMTRPLGSISGKLVLDPTKVPECEGKRPPLLSETLVRSRRPEKEMEKDDPLTMRLVAGSGSPDAAGAFTMRNLLAGRYQFEPKFYARYWYLQSITMSGAGPKPQRIDAAANWTTLKPGEQLSNLTITLAAGAGSIHGRVPVPDGAALPAGTVVYLIPSEREKIEDMLRYFVTDIAADGTFTFNNLPPGKYFALTQTNVEAQVATSAKLREPEAATARTKLRRTAETKKSEIELKPCQNLADYQLKQ